MVYQVSKSMHYLSFININSRLADEQLINAGHCQSLQEQGVQEAAIIITTLAAIYNVIFIGSQKQSLGCDMKCIQKLHGWSLGQGQNGTLLKLLT